MNAEVLWRKVEQLEGKYVTLIRGAKIHVYRVTDKEVFYDPVNGQSQGKHWAERSVIIQLANEILSGRRKAPEGVMGIEELCEELDIKHYQFIYSHLFAILCAIGVIRHPVAGRITDGK